MIPSRPLSPHLQIYKIQLTSLLSILHRLTGLILTTAIVALVLWIFTLALQPDCYRCMMRFYQSWLGKLVLFAWWTCFFYHFSNGIRHLAWDSGYGFEIRETYITGWIVIIITSLMSLMGLWVILS